MSKTGIEYGDYGFNSITGCKHGCPWGCWAEQLAKRRGEDFKEVTWHPERLDQPEDTKHRIWFESVNKELNRGNVPVRDIVLVNFQGDMFGDWVPAEYIAKTIKACGEAHWHEYLFLTKNPKRYAGFQEDINQVSEGNFWLGTSIEDGYHEERLMQLLDATIEVPFCKRWVSFEPLLGPLTIGPVLQDESLVARIAELDWVVIGALTGKQPKQPPYEWVRDLIRVCNECQVPYFIKNNLDWPEKHQAFPKVR